MRDVEDTSIMKTQRALSNVVEKLLIESRHERGFALPVIAIGLLATVTVLGLFMTLSYRSAVKSEFQSIVDTAALAGATQISAQTLSSGMIQSPGQRWALARSSALASIASQEVRALTGKTRLALSEAPDTEIPEPTWNSSGVTVTISRGRWLPGTGFSSYDERQEGVSATVHETNYPGVPSIIAFNAVKVEMVAQSRTIFTNLFPSVGVRAHAIAVGAAVESHPVAPFGIHVCSLMDQNQPGDFQSNFNPFFSCLADRLVTSTNRHCPEGEPDCLDKPQFSWDPQLAQDRGPGTEPGRTYFEEYWSSEPNPAVSVEVNSGTDSACFWPTPRYREPANNYMVYGRPGNTAPTEAEIRTIISNGSQTAGELGGKFQVLSGGLVEPESEVAVWNRIINADLKGDSTTNPPINQTDLTMFDNGYVNDNINQSFRRADSQWGAKCIDEAADIVRVKNGAGPFNNLPIEWRMDEEGAWGGGTCLSRRTGWGHWDDFTSGTGTDAYREWYKPLNWDSSKGPDTWFTEMPVWQPLVPVIADGRNINSVSSGDLPTACPGSGTDPSIVMDSGSPIEYEIIGFVKVNVYDVDIGNEPPTFPPNRAPFASANGWPFRGDLYNYDEDPYESLNGISAFDDNHPWAFKQPCNLIRTRLVCAQDGVPSSNTSGRSQPVLVPDN